MLTVGTNSWVTLAEADAYLATKYGAAAWAGLPVADREALLITAYNLLRLQSGYAIAPDAAAYAVKAAQIETAWWWYGHGAEWEKRAGLYAGGVRSFTVMSWSEGLAAPELPAYIKDMLTEFARGSGNYLPKFRRDY